MNSQTLGYWNLLHRNVGSMKDSSEVDVHAKPPAFFFPHHSWKIFIQRDSFKYSLEIRVRTCIIDEAVEFWLEKDLCLADQIGDALLLRDVADNEGNPVLAKLGRQLGQGVSSQALIDVWDTNFGTWTLSLKLVTLETTFIEPSERSFTAKALPSPPADPVMTNNFEFNLRPILRKQNLFYNNNNIQPSFTLSQLSCSYPTLWLWLFLVLSFFIMASFSLFNICSFLYLLLVRVRTLTFSHYWIKGRSLGRTFVYVWEKTQSSWINVLYYWITFEEPKINNTDMALIQEQ